MPGGLPRLSESPVSPQPVSILAPRGPSVGLNLHAIGPSAPKEPVLTRVLLTDRRGRWLLLDLVLEESPHLVDETVTQSAQLADLILFEDHELLIVGTLAVLEHPVVEAPPRRVQPAGTHELSMKRSPDASVLGVLVIL